MAYKKWIYGGRYQKCREMYFAIRDEKRVFEINDLLNDVEFLISELHRVERRAGVYHLVGPPLRNLYMRLYYWQRRQEDDNKTDASIFRVLTEHFCLHPNVITNTVFNDQCLTDWWIVQTEGGKEQDFYIPEGIRLELPSDLQIKKKHLRNTPKLTMRDEIIKLTKENDKLKKELRLCSSGSKQT